MKNKFIYKVILAVSSALIILVSLWQLLIEDSLTSSWTIYVFLLLVLWCIVFLVSAYKYYNTYYLFSSVYIACLIVFHAGHLILDAFGIDRYLYYHTGPMALWLEGAGWCSLLSLGSMGIGLSLSFKPKTIQKNIVPVHLPLFYSNLSVAYWMGIGLLMASATTLVIAFISLGNIFSYTRTELFGNIGDVRGFGYFIVVCPSALILMTVSATRKKQKMVAYSLTVFFAIALLAMGYRSSVLFSLVIGAVVWVKLGRKIPVAIPIIFFVFILITIPTVRYLRDLGPLNQISSDKIAKSVTTSKFKDTLRELGGTDYIVAYVLKTIPHEEPYRYGKSYLWGLKILVPNIGLQQSGSSRVRASGNSIVFQKKLIDGNPADWFIFKTNRWKYDQGLGSGFSAIGEAYLNFGFTGIVCCFLILGYSLGKIDHFDLKRNLNGLIFTGAFLWPLVKTVRNSFGVFVKPLGLILTTILIWRIFTFWKKHNKLNRSVFKKKFR